MFKTFNATVIDHCNFTYNYSLNYGTLFAKSITNSHFSNMSTMFHDVGIYANDITTTLFDNCNNQAVYPYDCFKNNVELNYHSMEDVIKPSIIIGLYHYQPYDYNPMFQIMPFLIHFILVPMII